MSDKTNETNIQSVIMYYYAGEPPIYRKEQIFYKCGNCLYDVIKKYQYCPMCGKKFVGILPPKLDTN